MTTPQNSRPALVAIFAHPDDEAFGPSGTLSLYSRTHDVYLLCATRGEAGGNHGDDTSRHLGEIREEELRRSASILGVKEVFFLNYLDGTLCNNIYHEFADRIQEHLDRLRPEILLTFESRGISGHIDHIVTSMVTQFIFNRIDYVKELLMVCISKVARQELNNYFIHVPPGYDHKEIDRIIDVSSVWEIKIKAMKEHISQMNDASRILESMKKRPKEEYFLVVKKYP